MPTENHSLAQRTLLTLGSFVLVVAILSWGQKVLIPVALAILLAFILTPPVLALQRRKVPRLAAVTLTVLLASGVVIGIGWIVSAQLQQLADELPQHTQNIVGRINSFKSSGDGGASRLTHMIEDIARQVKQASAVATGDENEKPQPVVIRDEQPMFLSVVPTVAGPAVELLASALLVVMLMIFILIRREDLRFRMIQLVGHGRLPLTTRALDEASERISAFLWMQLTINAGFGSVVFVLLWSLGVPFAFLWGFLALVLRFIPYIGTWIALAFPLLLSIAVAPDWYHPLILVGVYLVLEVVTANVVEPLLFSHSTGVSEIALLLAAAFWTWLWGPLGLLLSTPLTVCLIVLGRYVPALRSFDILLGSEPVMDADARFYQRLLAVDEEEATNQVEEYLQKGSREGLFDEIVLPALSRMRRDAERGELEAGEQQLICRIVSDILDDLEETDAAAVEPDADRALVIGCPARDNADELALRMLRLVLATPSCAVEVLSSDRLAAEAVQLVSESHPALVCIAALSPGGLAHVRYLCKRLRAEVPELKILVGRWGQSETSERLEQRLRSVGADHVDSTLRQTRDRALPLMQLRPGPQRERAATFSSSAHP